MPIFVVNLIDSHDKCSDMDLAKVGDTQFPVCYETALGFVLAWLTKDQENRQQEISLVDSDNDSAPKSVARPISNEEEKRRVRRSKSRARTYVKQLRQRVAFYKTTIIEDLSIVSSKFLMR